MSATTEILAEKLREIEELLAEATKAGQQSEAERLANERQNLVSKLSQANESLNEGNRRLLKG